VVLVNGDINKIINEDKGSKKHRLCLTRMGSNQRFSSFLAKPYASEPTIIFLLVTDPQQSLL
jgi:hypothetical protein